MRAIGNVRIVESDSLQIFGDTLDYDGNIEKTFRFYWKCHIKA